MKKKIITVMIAGVLALSATACGGSGDSSDAPQNDSVQEEENATPEAEQQTAEEESAEEPAEGSQVLEWVSYASASGQDLPGCTGICGISSRGREDLFIYHPARRTGHPVLLSPDVG